MPIKRCIARSVSFFMEGKLWNPKMKFSGKAIVYVFVEMESGELGVGEIWPAAGSAESVAFLINNDFSPLLAGEDPHAIDRLRFKVETLAPLGSLAGLMLNAWSGVDLALWDLRGQLLGKPVCELLGTYSENVYVYASGGLYGKDKGLPELANEVRSYVEDGFTGVKMKIGGQSIAEDVQRVATVREAIGKNTRLMVDALHAYDVAEALELAEAVSDYDIYWFESPVTLEDQAGHGLINTSSGISVCANESLSGITQYRHLLEHGGADFVHFDLSVCGGISEALKIAALAESKGLQCTIHAASGVALFAASVQFATSIPNCDSVEYHFVHQWLSEHKAEAMAHEGPWVTPLQEPGLGMSFLIPDFIEKVAAEEKRKATVH